MCSAGGGLRGAHSRPSSAPVRRYLDAMAKSAKSSPTFSFPVPLVFFPSHPSSRASPSRAARRGLVGEAGRRAGWSVGALGSGCGRCALRVASAADATVARGSAEGRHQSRRVVCVRVRVWDCQRGNPMVCIAMIWHDHHSGGLDQLADRSLRMREVRGSKPRFSIFGLLFLPLAMNSSLLPLAF